MKNTRKWEHPYDYDPRYDKRVVYMSMEFGIDQALKIYSGGLGYLAGSHMRSAYQLKQNLIGIGMLWKYGYYDQVRDEIGQMKILFRQKHYSFLEDTGITVPVYVKGHQVLVRAFYLDPRHFNTVPMYFLTTDTAENDELSRSISTRLYHPNDTTRIAQNIVLGIGGAKVAEKLGGTDLYHMNEAHSLPVAFHLFRKYGKIDEVKKRLVFTTHTPEMAGNSVRDFALCEEMGMFNEIPGDVVRKLTGLNGHAFEYTPAALRLSRLANGVSKIHGEVANEMWANYKGICQIKSITNAQDEVYWTDPQLKKHLEENDDHELIARKKAMKRELFTLVADQTGDFFDEDALTIVWARRFAGYKRADLIVRDLDRLMKLINDADRKVQIIWAGKPYPEDMVGVSQFNHIHSLTLRHPNLAILTGYELKLSAALKKGADVWLNTPRITREASGTSGMTAAMNGAINFSTWDGWIPEFAKDGHNSFIIPEYGNPHDIFELDDHDHEHMMDILEKTIVPMYYNKPKSWLRIMKNSMKDVVPRFDTKRMAHEYYKELYNG